MFYKLIVNGTLKGQDIKNIFYYRTGIGVDVGGIALGGAPELAQEFYDEVWPSWKAAVSNLYTLEQIEVYPINATFQLAYSLPHIKLVQETGTVPGELFSPAACVNIRFNLESMPITQIITAPKRGYVAIAGVTEGQVTDGLLDMGFFNNDINSFKALGNKLAQNIESVLPPVIFFPIRVKLVDNPLADSPLWTGYADIAGATVTRSVSWRRSRRPE